MGQENKENDYELDKIRLRKMKSLVEAKKRQKASQERIMNLWEKIDYVLRVVLMPDAYSHLNYLKANEPQVYQKIINELAGQEVIENIDYLLAIIAQKGGIPKRIPLDVIIYLERQAKGIKSKIQVKRKDEVMDLSSYISK